MPCSRRGNAAIAYETVRLADGSLPLLTPMSEVAGRMAPLMGAHHLMSPGGGRGGPRVRGPRGASGQGGDPRRRRGRHGRGHPGRRDALGGLHPRPQSRASPPGRPPLPGRPEDGGLEHPCHRGVVASTPTSSSARSWWWGPRHPSWSPTIWWPRSARGQSWSTSRWTREAARVDPAHHALRSDLRGRRLGVLLRGQHARGRPPLIDPRPGERHAALRAQDRRPRLA